MRLLLLGLVVVICGCASGYSQFYQAYPNAQQIAERRVAPAPPKPASERAGGDINEVFATYLRRGYGAIGFSSFNSGMDESDASAMAQGAKVGADLVVIIDPNHTETRTASVPITTPTTSTSHTTGSATAYGAGGSATAYGNSTTTTYGSQTNYVPITVNRYDYGAIYFVKTRPSFGAYFRDLNDDERRQLQTNKGTVISLIVDGSPAYDSDVLVGDVIVAVNGKAVNGIDGLMGLIKENRGKVVTVSILRGQELISKSVSLSE